MKFLFPVIIFLYISPVFSQDSIPSIDTYNGPVYINIDHYKKHGDPLTKQDSLNFKFRNNDTLVLVPEGQFEKFRPKGVRTEYEPRDSTFLEKYKDAVFINQSKKYPATIKIWKDDVKVYFDSSVPLKDQKLLMGFAVRISSNIDSLTIREVKNKEDSNYFVYFKNDPTDIGYDPKIAADYTGYYINWNEKQQIYKGSLQVNTYKYKTHLSYLQDMKSYFFKSLGFFSYSDRLPCQSILSPCDTTKALTFPDLDILKYHYSYGMCKGIPLEKFLNLHHRMKKVLDSSPHAKAYIIHEE